MIVPPKTDQDSWAPTRYRWLRLVLFRSSRVADINHCGSPLVHSPGSSPEPPKNVTGLVPSQRDARTTGPARCLCLLALATILPRCSTAHRNKAHLGKPRVTVGPHHITVSTQRHLDKVGTLVRTELREAVVRRRRWCFYLTVLKGGKALLI